MTSRYRPPAKPIEPLDSWKAGKLTAIFGDIPGCGCGLIVIGLAAAIFFWGASANAPEAEPGEPTAEERALLFDAERVTRLVGETVDPAFERALRTPQRGGVDLEYMYDPDEGTFVYTVLWVGKNSNQVPGKYQEFRVYALESLGDEVTPGPVDGACRWGLGSQCGTYLFDGTPVGNYFFAHRGRVTLFIQVLHTPGGSPAETPKELDALFVPYLKHLEEGIR